MKQRTHDKINEELSGTLISLEKNYSKIRLVTNKKMITDDTGLIHGGFIFSLADYAAMLAVNHPNVVLGSANVKFIKPVSNGQILLAEGKVIETRGKKINVKVEVKTNNNIVCQGDFICFTPEQHILNRDEK